jgi:hypothetical protein
MRRSCRSRERWARAGDSVRGVLHLEDDGGDGGEQVRAEEFKTVIRADDVVRLEDSLDIVRIET